MSCWKSQRVVALSATMPNVEDGELFRRKHAIYRLAQSVRQEVLECTMVYILVGKWLTCPAESVFTFDAKYRPVVSAEYFQVGNFWQSSSLKTCTYNKHLQFFLAPYDPRLRLSSASEKWFLIRKGVDVAKPRIHPHIANITFSITPRSLAH